VRLFLRDTRGGVAVIGALAFSALLGCAAFAIDLSNLFLNKSQLQSAGDAAALGAVLAIPDSTAAKQRALDLVNRNTPSGYGSLSTAQDVVLGTWDSGTKTFAPSTGDQNAIQVRTYRTAGRGNAIPTFFGRFVGLRKLDTEAVSVAVKIGGACVFVLDPSASGALTVSGSGKMAMNCPLQINSSSASAAKSGGAARVQTAMTCVVGGYSGGGFTPAPTTGCPALKDPLASVPEPAAPSCTVANPTISSGIAPSNCTYTGTVSLDGSITLQSGLFYFKNATIKVSNSTNISGSGVTLFLDPGSTLSLNGGGTISLSAATEGSYKGILIFQSRSAPSSRVLSLGGSGTLSLNGTLYAPSSELQLSGNSTYANATKMGYAVSRTLSVGGSGEFSFNSFPTTGVSPRNMLTHASLVN
jgi:hypothetical protein